jgi:serine/threonine protein kinase
MEYIHGKDLMVVINELKKRKKTIPIPMAIYIASKMCEALHYAHNFTNKLTGQKYNIVHRDISPHNAMVSYEGYVKVIDFGIAKADTNTTEEAEGTIKGKVNYFAPEYLEGKKIDHRYDQFAVALTLWEMLTGEKTFKAPDQLLTLKTILECNPSLPSRHNKEVPKSLDKIVMKAMSKEPVNRYKDMQAFNKELMKMLYQTYPDFHESDVSEMMKVLFKKSYENDLEKFKGFGKYSISEIVQKINAFKDFQIRQKEKQQSSGKGQESMFDFGFTEESISARGKKGLDKLVTGKKKGRPGKDVEKNQKKRQRALAALLEDDDDFVKAEGILEQNKGKLIFIGIVLLGYFQKELIMEMVLGSKNGVRGIISTSGQNEKGTELREIEKAGNKHAEAMKFVEQLKKKQAAKENPKELKVETQPINIAKQAPSLVNKNIPTNKAMEPISADLNKEAVKVLDSLKNPKKTKVIEVANQATATKTVAPIVKKVQENPALEPVQVKAVPVANVKAEELVDLQNISIDDLKKRMEAQLAERKQQISRPIEDKSQGTITGGAEGRKANIINTETSPNTENVEEVVSVNNENVKAEVNNEPVRNDVSESVKKVEEIKLSPELTSKTPQNPSNVISPKKPMTQAERELQELRDKMAKILEDRKKLEEAPGIKKVNIALTEEEKKIAEEKSKAEIQRELASKLKEMDDDSSNKLDQGTEETTTDKVFKFIKSRRAFSWFFNE